MQGMQVHGLQLASLHSLRWRVFPVYRRFVINLQAAVPIVHGNHSQCRCGACRLVGNEVQTYYGPPYVITNRTQVRV